MESDKLIARINTLLIKNKALTKEARTEFEKYVLEIRKGASADRLSEINKKLTETKNSMRGLHRLGALWKEQMAQARESFFKWFSAGSVIKPLISQTEKAISEIREMDTLLTQIGAKNDALSASALQKTARQSFDVAGRYGKKAADYLSGYQEASRAGYQNPDEIAELSLAAQSAGGLTAQLANQLIFAADQAYGMNGSIAELTGLLDGMNSIANHNAVSMAQLAQGLSAVGEAAAASGMDARETAAALAAIMAATRQDGTEAAQTLKDILSGGQLAETGSAAEALARYQAMLQQYTDGSGSLAKEAERMADTWEGSLNRLSNTWTATLGNIVSSDAVTTAMDGLNSLLSVVHTLTDALGPLGSLGAFAGITSFVKNFA